jgi:hypothetical protein
LIEADLHATRKLPKDFQLAIYLNWIAFDSPVRKQANDYKVSHELILKARRTVTHAINKNIYGTYVKQIINIPQIDDNKFFIRFQGILGCIDGSHIGILVPSHIKGAWRNRKKVTSTNCFFMCDVRNTMLFTYARVG